MDSMKKGHWETLMATNKFRSRRKLQRCGSSWKISLGSGVVQFCATILEHQSEEHERVENVEHVGNTWKYDEIIWNMDLVCYNIGTSVILLVRFNMFNTVVDTKWPSASAKRALTWPGVWKPSWLQPTSGHLHDSSRITGGKRGRQFFFRGDRRLFRETKNFSTQSDLTGLP